MNALEECGADYDDHMINIMKGEQKTAAYRFINPRGKVPALIADGALLTENASILVYLDEQFPDGGLLPKTATPTQRAQYVSDLVWCSATVHPMVRQVRMPVRFTDADPSGVEQKGREYLDGILPEIEQRVVSDRWWYGTDWSIVDTYLNWCYTTAASADYSLSPYPAVQAHSERVQSRPAYQRVLERERLARQKSRQRNV